MRSAAPVSSTVRLGARTVGGVPVAAVLVALALVAWVAIAMLARGEHASPATGAGVAAWYVGMWVTMTAAMMLPSVLPMVVTFARVSAQRATRGQGLVPAWVFVAGYGLAWTAYGVLAYALLGAIASLQLELLAWDRQGPLVAAAAVAAAGLYQLTPLKQACLSRCRHPLHYVMHGWRPGRLGALRMGAEHGLHCVGCCWGLMVVLFAVGVMSLPWMGVVAVLMLAEKVLPRGERLSRPIGVALLALAAGIALAPASVPALTDPGPFHDAGDHVTHPATHHDMARPAG